MNVRFLLQAEELFHKCKPNGKRIALHLMVQVLYN